ncbi:hypothetical protein BC937DRAFT_94833 [Endogone sp. FLAS-F59071]|nr:hypothetical protein BC937DRAFT_94833 [Endogone sp. FLAS-F59071]|eukprot:RUS13752.1 hypothetical protein BC937DRAFT_94833 [Endogone sp. FLAS-F59071]
MAPTVVPIAGAALPNLIDKWDFGTWRRNSKAPTGCHAAGNAAFIMCFPTSEIFWDPPIPPGPGYVAAIPPGLGIAATVDIDLYQIQQLILNCHCQ